MDYETKKLKVVLWTVVSLLILSVLGVSLLFILKMHPSTPTPNQVNVGERISRASFKSTLTNADVWDGTSSTDWSGSGTSSSPYLITRASQLSGLSTSVNNGTNYSGKYFKLANDLDMNGDTLTFTPIGSTSSKSFKGNFDGDGHSIVDLQIATSIDGGLFCYVANSTISDLNIEIIFTQNPSMYFGGLAYYVTDSSKIENVNISYSGTYSIKLVKYCYTSGLIHTSRDSTIKNCKVINFIVDAEDVSKWNEIYIAGLIGNAYNTTVEGCMADVNFDIRIPNTSDPWVSMIAGLIGYESGTSRAYNNNLTCGKIKVTIDSTSPNVYIGGMISRPSGKPSAGELVMRNNLSQCDIDVTSVNSRTILSGLSGDLQDGQYSKYNIFNGTINAKSKFNMVGGVDTSATSTAKVVYNKDRFLVTGASSLNTVGATSDADMKLRSTYADWEDFDTYWVVGEKANNGYPMLKKFIEVAKVTGFEGRGTEASPYLVKTHQDLLGLASYYNDNDLTKAEIYWQLANDIDVSKDANNMLIHFTPICYAKEFDGYLDGNGKTISGLLIDHQYEYAGLFGTIGANHWVKNLTVKGKIYWDQAYAVGGVAGRVMADGYLQDCKFEGDIIGLLNTKPSTECNGVVGKYELNGAVDCTATYTDLKYAKIGGTTDAPTYTYYLYDWAQLTTSLYNKKVS